MRKGQILDIGKVSGIVDRPTMRYELLGVTPTTGQWKWKKEIALEAVENYIE